MVGRHSTEPGPRSARLFSQCHAHFGVECVVIAVSAEDLHVFGAVEAIPGIVDEFGKIDSANTTREISEMLHEVSTEAHSFKKESTTVAFCSGDAHFADDFLEAVNEFHATLVDVTGTKTLTFMNQLLINLLSRHQEDYKHRHPLDHDVRRKGLQAGLKSYEKLVDLIESGQVEEAVKHWRLHLTNANATWAADNEGARIVDSLGA